jgi:hypothetical protein
VKKENYFLEVSAMVLAEAAATVFAVKSAIDGKPLNVYDLTALFGLSLEYGMSAVAVLYVVKKLIPHHIRSQNISPKQ